MFSKCLRLLVIRIASWVMAVAAIRASTSPVGLPMALSLLLISPNFIAHGRSKGIIWIISKGVIIFPDSFQDTVRILPHN